MVKLKAIPLLEILNNKITIYNDNTAYKLNSIITSTSFSFSKGRKLNMFDSIEGKLLNKFFTPMIISWVSLLTLIFLYYLFLRKCVFRLEDTRVEVAVAGILLIVTIGALALFLLSFIFAFVFHCSTNFALSAFRLVLFFGPLLVLMVVLSQLTAYTPAIDGVGSIAELRKIEVNGRNEWLLIRGEDRTKPIILFLAGGPGGSHLATARYYFKELESEYVVVTWEQPGAAKSLSAIDPADMTLDIYLDDGAAVAKYLCQEFGQAKIYLMGESWGSALGLMMVNQHPEFYYSFIGTGQMVDFLETELIDYQFVLDDAIKSGNKTLVNKLEKQGPPPYRSEVASKTIAYLFHLNGIIERTGKLNSVPFSTMDGPFGVEYGLLDKVNFFWGLLRTFDTFYEKLYFIDLRERCPELEVPVYVFQGRYDYNAPAQLVEEYMDKLKAPEKSLIYFEHSGHNPWQTENTLFLQRAIKVFRNSQ